MPNLFNSLKKAKAFKKKKNKELKSYSKMIHKNDINFRKKSNKNKIYIVATMNDYLRLKDKKFKN